MRSLLIMPKSQWSALTGILRCPDGGHYTPLFNREFWRPLILIDHLHTTWLLGPRQRSRFSTQPGDRTGQGGGAPERQMPWDNEAARASGLPSCPQVFAALLHRKWVLKSWPYLTVCAQFTGVNKHLNQNTVSKCWASAQNLVRAQ